mgnify:CR=1 FL=1
MKKNIRWVIMLALCIVFTLLFSVSKAATYSWSETKVYPNARAENLTEGSTALDLDGSGNTHLAFIDDSTDVDGRTGVFYSYEVGSGGDCDNLYTGGSDAYECALIDSTAVNGDALERSLDFKLTSTDKPRIVWKGGVSGNDLYYGSCDTSCGNPANWTTTQIDSTITQGQLALDSLNNPSVVYMTGGDLFLAEYVGGGLGSGCDSSNWTCTAIESTDTLTGNPDITFNSSNQEVVIFGNSTDTDVIYAVRTAGSGCSNSNWTCAVIDSASTTFGASIVLDSDKPRVAYSKSNKAYYSSCDANCTTGTNWTTPEAVFSNPDIPAIGIDTSTNTPFITAGREIDDVMGEQTMAERIGTGGDCSDTNYGGTAAWECHDVTFNGSDFGHGHSSIHLSSPIISFGTGGGAFVLEGTEDEESQIPELPSSNLWKVLIAVLALGLVVGIVTFLKKKK